MSRGKGKKVRKRLKLRFSNMIPSVYLDLLSAKIGNKVSFYLFIKTLQDITIYVKDFSI